jgi:hypothetical protein
MSFWSRRSRAVRDFRVKPATWQVVLIEIHARSSVRISAARVRSSASNDPLTPWAGSRHEDRYSGGF